MTEEECLRCLPDTTKHSGRGGSRYLPFAFTEAGVQVLKTLMKSSVDIDFSDEPPLPAVYEESWNEGTVVLYQPNKDIKIDVRVENETVWLSVDQMAILFGRDRTVIGRHIRNIYKEGELEESLVSAKFAHTKDYGRRAGYTQTKDVVYYNLDVIISVGYRVKSVNGTRFRQWANGILKQYLMKGYAIDQRRLELCFEDHRWYDLRRTQSWYPKDIKHVFSYSTSTSGYVGTVNETEVYTLRSASPNYTFELPLAETSINSSIKVYGKRENITGVKQ